MITWILVFIIALFLADMLLSYNYLKSYRENFPKNDWTQVEANPIIRYFIRSSGLENGIIYGGLCVFFLLGLMLVYFGHHFHYFIAGVYYMMCLFHFLNLMALIRLKKLKGGKR